MKIIDNNISRLNDFQQNHGLAGFIYAVLKKFGEDESGRQSSLLTYYAFWSLFPLLIALTTLTQIFIAGHTTLHHEIYVSVSNYFPILGQRLQQNVHLSGKGGAGLAVSILLTIYGARGVSEAFRYTVNHCFRISPKRMWGFPKNVVNDFILIGIGGIGLIGTSVIAGLATGGSHLFWARSLYVVINIVLLFAIFEVLFKVSFVAKVKSAVFYPGAAICAIGLTLLQLVGGLIINHELKNLNSLYGSFALALGLLFWLSLEAQVIVYAVEINTVFIQKLWPRSLENKKPTVADQQSAKSLAKIYT